MPTERIRQVPFVALMIGSFFFVGLSPISSGTVGSAVAAALYYAIPQLQLNWVLLVLCAICLIAGSIASNVIVLHTKEHDAGIIVIDEVLGQWVALLSLWYAGDLLFVIVAFVLFRIFDIVKVYPASRFERSTGGASICCLRPWSAPRCHRTAGESLSRSESVRTGEDGGRSPSSTCRR